MEHFSQSQWSSWAYTGAEDNYSPYAQMSNYPAYLADSMDAYQLHQNHLVHPHSMSRTTESKPRLSKEEVELLEAEFQKNHKPNSSTKKALAESMRVDNARINNWFQNRRAREKKENNIREYEAKQKLEKEKTEAETGHRMDNNRQRDLVASSAPFPDATRPSHPQSQASASPSDLSTADMSSETTGSVHGPDPDDVTSPFVSTPQALDPVTIGNMHRALSDGMESDVSDQMSDYLGMSDASLTIHQNLHTPETVLSLSDKSSHNALANYQSYMGTSKNPLSCSQFMFPDNHQLPHQQSSEFDDTLFLEEDSSTDAMSAQFSHSKTSQLSSPPSIDIASRRNRRPPPLALSGVRSHSACAPKTAIELSKRSEQGGPMRRVASATGSGRITKSVATPHSPFERKAESILQMSRSPSTTAPGTVAPPTPDTPILLGDAAVSSVVALGGKRPATNWAVHDPTLRTPPTTPGLMGSLFTLNSGYGMAMPNDGLSNTHVNNFLDNFDIPGDITDLSSYMASSNDSSSQSDASPLGPQLGSSCFNVYGETTGFNWSEV